MNLYRYFFREYGETIVGIIQADNMDDAIYFFTKTYGTQQDVHIEKASFNNYHVCEVYYGG